MDILVRVALREVVVDEAEQFQHLLWKVVIGIVAPPQRCRRLPVGSRGAAQSEVDAPRGERLEHAELLGDHQRCVVGQHHAAGTEPDALRLAGQASHHQLGREGRGTGHGVVF